MKDSAIHITPTGRSLRRSRGSEAPSRVDDQAVPGRRRGCGALHAGRWRAPVLALLAFGTACDIPTEAPRWTTSWTFVGVEDEIVTSELLPTAVREEGTSFVLDSIRSVRTVRLSDVCEVCTCFSGPIPRIEITPQNWSVPLPNGVWEASLSRGTARLVLRNELGFDLLDNGEGERGYLLAELVDNRTREVVDSVRVTDPFPSGDSLVVSFDLSGLELHRNMVARVQGVTPGSGCESIDLSGDPRVQAQVGLQDVRATSVVVFLTDAAVSVPDETIELPDAILDRLRAGEAQVVVDAEITTRVGASFDLLMSVAREPAELFSEDAALYTPLEVPPGSLEQPGVVRKQFLVDVERLENASRLLFSARNRVVGDRRVTIRGGEGVSYRILIHAELPSS